MIEIKGGLFEYRVSCFFVEYSFNAIKKAQFSIWRTAP